MDNFLIDNVPFYRCAKVLPTAYDNSLSYYEDVCKLTSRMNELIDVINNNFEVLVREQVNKFFVATTYDAKTESLILSLKEGE